MRSSVSRTASKCERGRLRPSVTVRHAPFTAMLSPTRTPARDRRRLDHERAPRAARGSSAATVPTASTIPVNTPSAARSAARSRAACGRAPRRSRPAARSAGSAASDAMPSSRISWYRTLKSTNLRPCAVEITTTRSLCRITPRSTSFSMRGERHARVRAVEQAGAVGARARLGDLRLARLLDDAVVAPDRVDRLLVRDRIADLDRRRERRPRARSARTPRSRAGRRGRAGSRASACAHTMRGRRDRRGRARPACRGPSRAPRRCRGCRPGSRSSRAPPSRTAATISMPTVFWPSMRRLFIEFAR